MSSDARLVAGIYPRPWTTLTLAGGLTAVAGAYTPAVRQWLDMVQLCGQLGASIPSGTTLFTLPVGFRPAQGLKIAVAGSTTVVGAISISTAGVVTFTGASTVTVVSLDSVFFRIV